jgi:putative ABC transport system permease protein
MRSLFALFGTVSIRYLRKRWSRAGLIVASIALGVAMLVSTQILNQCLDTAANEASMPGGEAADLVVTANRRVSLALVKKLQAVPGVASALPLVTDRVVLPEFKGRDAVLIGLDLKAAQSAERSPFEPKFTLTNPAALISGKAVVVGKDLARILSPDGLPTKPFQIRCGGKTHSLQPIGVVELQGKAAKIGGFLLVADVDLVARTMGQDGLCERVDVYASPGADIEAVQQAAQAAIGEQAQVRTPEAASKPTNEVVGGIRTALDLSGVGAMVVGLFLVYIVLAVSVAERRHDIGILRSTGANRFQIAGLFTGEAIVMGTIGALLGVPLGWGLAKLTFALVQLEMEQIFLTANQPLKLTMSIFLLALGSGVATSWMAALLPAMQAASDQPADAVRRGPAGAGRFFRYLQALGSVAMIATGFGFVLIREYLPYRVGGFGGAAMLLVGLLLSVPILVGLLSRMIKPLTRLFGVETRLAADNLLRAPGRTGIVVGVLAAGVMLIFQVAGLVKSNQEPVMEWLQRAISADLFVVSGDPGAPIGIMSMQPQVAQQLTEVPGVEAAMSLRYAQPEFNGRIVFVTALDAKVYHDFNRHAERLPKLGLFQEMLEPNTCIVSENFAALNHVGAGDSISLQGPHGPVPMRILGAVPEYSWSRGSILLNREFYAKAFEDPLIDSIHVYLKPDHRDEAWKRVKEFTDSHALLIVTRDEFDEMVTSLIRRIYALAYLQQSTIALVALLGVVAALLISVMQRRRELGLLRAVGATRGQVLHTVLAEATLMGIFGTLIGIAAGVPFEWYLLRVVIFEESGFIFPVTFPWRETLILSGLAIGSATIAGLFPAMQAVRLRIAESIAYE